ncbi:hypothetical protein H1R20_g3898, partial [Candolleomyces eurysporus]
MRFLTSFIAVLLLSVSAMALNVARTDTAGKKPPHSKVCDPNAKGKDLEKRRYDAVADFADLFLFKQDIRAAFDKYVPGEYIQHNPRAEQGRDFAIEVLTAGAASGIVSTNLTFFVGQGYGFMHYKSVFMNTTYAIVDYFRFKGTCIVEHWDVLQEITGNEPNPIAFF